MTAPARSTETLLAQVREALRDLRDAGDRPGMYAEGQDALAALDLIEQQIAEMLENPVSWREQTFRLRMEAAEQRATDMEKALRRYGRHGTFCADSTGGVCDCGLDAALSAREEAR